MEPLFEVRFYMDWRSLAEFLQKIRTGPRLRMMIPCLLIYVGVIIFSIYQGTYEQMRTMLLAVGVIYVLLPLLPIMLAKSSIKTVKTE